jgi:hypothetical protein
MNRIVEIRADSDKGRRAMRMDGGIQMKQREFMTLLGDAATAPTR